ncbi:MAG TPA: hypothetical protein VJZ91_00180, partial [Blastocatellia bacterium]|nr:hypothetical protein [Blastocatellia bacterium]
IAVQEAAQVSPTASAALTEVAARLKELAAYHEQIRSLVSLLEVLRVAREQFAPLSRLADPREIIDLRIVRPQWDGLRAGSLGQLDRLMARLYQAAPPAALAALQAASGRVDDSLRDERFNPLRLALKETGLNLATAETAVRDELNEAITSVLALSQRTLGQMNL